MPPLLALGACAVLVLALLAVERRSTPASSWALLIPTIWLLIVASRPLATWFPGAVGGSFDEGSPLDRSALTVLLVASISLLLSRRTVASGIHLSRHVPLILLYGFAALTIIWSDHPFVSVKRWIRLIGIVPIALVIATEIDPVGALTTIVRRIAYITIPFSLVLIKYFPVLGASYSRWSGVLMWNGVTTTKNALGQLCLLTIVVLLWDTLRRWRQGDLRSHRSLLVADLLVGLTAIYLMVGTPSGAYSATSIAVLAYVTGSVVLLYIFRTSARGLSSLVCGGAVIGWLAMIFVQSFVAEVSLLLGRDETFTGRTELWAKVLSDASARPLLGTGFGAYFNTNNEFTTLYGNGGHNGLLDVYVETGVAGVLILLGFIAWYFVSARRTIVEFFQFGVLAVALLLMNLSANFTESLFMKSSSLFWTMLIVTSVLMGSKYWVAATWAQRPSKPVRRFAGRRRVRHRLVSVQTAPQQGRQAVRPLRPSSRSGARQPAKRPSERA